MKRLLKLTVTILLVIGLFAMIWLVYVLLDTKAAQCVDSGGIGDGEGGCICKYYDEDGFCLSSPLTETFEADEAVSPQITINFRGIENYILIDGKRLETAEIYYENLHQNIIGQDIGFAVSIPHFREKTLDKWDYNGCTFERIPLNEQIGISSKDQPTFMGICASGKVKTMYTIQYPLRLVSFTIHNPTELLHSSESTTYYNTDFLAEQ